MTHPQDKPIDLGLYARMLWRHKAIIILCLVTTFCSALIALQFSPNEYESSVTLLVEDTGLVSRDVLEITGGMMQTQGGYKIDEERMAKLAGRIRSRPFLERVVRMLRMQEDPLVQEMARDRLESNPDVSLDEMAVRLLVRNLQSRINFRTRGPGVYEVTVADRTARNAQLLGWWVSELFVDVTDQRNLETIREAEVFGQDRLRRFDERLRQAEQAYEAARRGGIDRDLAPSMVRPGNLQAVEALRQKAKDEAARARIRMRTHEERVTETGLVPDTAILLASPPIKEISDRMSEALRTEVTDRLAATASVEVGEWPPDGTYGILRRDLLQRAERLVAEQYPYAPAEARNSIVGILLSKLDAAAGESVVTLLDNAIDEFKRQASSNVVDELELARLESDVDRNRRLREKGEDYIVATDVRRAIETANLGLRTEILDPARLPLDPSRPNRKKILMASLLLGGMLGAGLAFVIETLDPVLRTVEDFGRIVSEPILGTMPLLSRKLPARRGWLRRHWAPACIVLVALLTGGFFLTQERLFYKLVAQQMPVQMVSPEGGPDEAP